MCFFMWVCEYFILYPHNIKMYLLVNIVLIFVSLYVIVKNIHTDITNPRTILYVDFEESTDIFPQWKNRRINETIPLK